MRIRHAAWAGQFYPAEPDQLSHMLDSYIEAAEFVEPDGRVVGVMAPHAGYTFSGRTAATAYKHLVGSEYKTIVVLAPSHATFINGASVYSGDAYQTPLGEIAVDKTIAQALESAAPNIHLGEAGHELDGDRAEHSLEVQLPFLQFVLGEFQLVPIVFHDYSWSNCRQLGKALAQILDADSTLLVASSDLYHGQSYEECQRQDEATLHSIENDTPETFCYGANSGEFMACGAGPIAVLKIVADEWNAQQPRVVTHTTSADVTGSRGGYVVGYAAAIVVH